ncbi:hypothetical protein ACFLUC_02015 [Chloroflexota bacterium]
MNDFLQQITNLLNSDVGGLAYHLVLAFSIAAALQAALSYGAGVNSIQRKRMAVGLTILLVFQVILFISAALAWQGLINGDFVIPSLDRAMALLSLITIVWLWAFPKAVRMADAATLLLGLLALILVALSTIWWIEQGSTLPYNGSYPDLITSVSAIAISIFGIVILILQKPSGWGYAVSMLALILIGCSIHLLVTSNGNYSGAVRLTQMAAFPLLLLLPQRLLTSSPVGSYSTVEGDTDGWETWLEKRPSYTDPKVMHALLNLSTEADLDKICIEITSTIARIMEADICILISAPDEVGNLPVNCCFDLANEVEIDDLVLEYEKFPELSKSMRLGRISHLDSTSEITDLEALSGVLKIERTGDVLFVPVVESDGSPISGVILLSPSFERDWTQGDQYYLNVLAKLMVQFLQNRRKIIELQTELDATQQEMRDSRTNNYKMADQWVPESSVDEIKNLNEELRLALDEIAHLKENSQPLRSVTDS